MFNVGENYLHLHPIVSQVVGLTHLSNQTHLTALLAFGRTFH